MRTLTSAPPTMRKVVFEVLRAHYPNHARINIGVTAVESDRPIPSIEARVMGPTARSAGAADVLLLIDAGSWRDGTEAERTAIADHGLALFEPVIRSGEFVMDVTRRPRVRRCKPDLAVTGFAAVLERHGVTSIERSEVDTLKTQLDRQGSKAMRDRIKRRHSRTNPDTRPYPS